MARPFRSPFRTGFRKEFRTHNPTTRLAPSSPRTPSPLLLHGTPLKRTLHELPRIRLFPPERLRRDRPRKLHEGLLAHAGRLPRPPGPPLPAHDAQARYSGSRLLNRSAHGVSCRDHPPSGRRPLELLSDGLAQCAVLSAPPGMLNTAPDYTPRAMPVAQPIGRHIVIPPGNDYAEQ